MDAPHDPPADAVPTSVRRAGALVLAEGVALALVGLAYAVSGLLGSPDDRAGAVLLGAIAVGVGLLLVPVGRGLVRARSWAVAPSIVVQLFIGAVAVGLFQGGVLHVAVPLLVLAAAVLYLLSVSGSREALRDDR